MPVQPSASKTPPLSSAELAQLEHAFATDPASDAYRPLAEAYLSMGRFMEAMVVCKKGVKAHPNQADPRVLLARVYAEQGKDRKAIEELEGAINAAPTDAAALRMAAGLLLKSGENDKGKDYLTRAYRAAPGDAETQDLLKKWKIAVEPEAPPVLSPAAAPPAAIQQAAPAPTLQQAAQIPVLSPPPRAAAPAARPAIQPPRAQPSRPPPARPQRPALDLSRFEEPDEPVRQSNTGGLVTLGFFVLAVVGLAGYFLWTRHVKQQSAIIAAALHETAEALGRDSYGSYKKACEAAERILQIDPDSVAGHAYLAYAYAIRWGEHGEGETAKEQALMHLEAAKKLRKEHSHLVAAEALIEFFGGNAAQAETDLEQHVSELEAKGKASALVYETLGIIEMRNGDLEKASTSLGKALNLAPADPRIYAALGDLYRRRGQEINAWNSYDSALRYEKDHADALLGKALLVLEAEHPNYDIAESLIRRVRDADPPPSPRQLAMAYLLDGIRLNQIGKKAEGLAQEEKALQMDPSNPEIRVLRGRRMLHDGQASEGLGEIKKAIEIDPKRASFYVELAKAQLSSPNGAVEGAKDAIKSLNTALKTLPNSAKLLTMLGDAYRQTGDLKSAQADYEKALNIDKTAKLPDARLAMAEILRKNRDWAKAEEHYERAAQEYAGTTGKVAEAYCDEAEMLEEKGEKPQRVLEAFQKALAADAGYAPSYFQVAKLLASNRKTRSKAKEALAEYLKLDPKGPHAADAQRMMRSIR